MNLLNAILLLPKVMLKNTKESNIYDLGDHQGQTVPPTDLYMSKNNAQVIYDPIGRDSRGSHH